MKPHEVTALMAQMSLVPKRVPVTFHNARVDDKGRGTVEIVSDATQPTISRWFDQIGAVVTRVESIPFHPARLIIFDWK